MASQATADFRRRGRASAGREREAVAGVLLSMLAEIG